MIEMVTSVQIRVPSDGPRVKVDAASASSWKWIDEYLGCDHTFPGQMEQYGRLVIERRDKMISRRDFLDTLAVGATGLAICSTAKSYGQIVGSNDRLNFAIIGLRWRGYAHLSGLKANKDSARLSHICDVDNNILAKFAGVAEHELGFAPASEKDFRNILEQKDVDAITIATPDHWHAPLAVAALQAGKHVYVE